MPLSYNVIKRDYVNSCSVYTIKAPAVVIPRMDVKEEIPENFIEDARIKAESIINEAKEKSEAILKNAKDEAARIKKETFDAAFKKGYAEGLKKGREDGYIETEKIRIDAKEVLDEAHRVSREYIERERNEIISLAYKIAEKIIRYEVNADDSAILNIVKESIDAAVVKSKVIIRVNPMDYAIVESGMEDMARLLDENAIISIIKDGEISRGGCRVETDSTSVDGTIESQLQIIKEALSI